MPLAAEEPLIDDRSWQDIVDEVRARIPHYTPEWRPVWNDLNDSDPGIVLTQVFAHLADMLLFRMQRVPALAYIKFLELIGIDLAAAQPAQVEISFAVQSDWPQATVLVSAGTQVSATGDDGQPVVFETSRSLTAVNLQLSSLQEYDGAQYRDQTKMNTDASVGYTPFGATPRAGGALTLGMAFPDGYTAAGGDPDQFPAVSLDLAFWTMQPPGAALVRQCGAPITGVYTPAQLVWEGWNGSNWVGLDSLSDETSALTRSGHVKVRIAATAQLARDWIGTYQAVDANATPQPKLFWVRARLAKSQYERAPLLRAVRMNTVPALQAQTVTDEILGGSSGERSQTFTFANSPLLEGSIRIEIDEGTGPNVWTVVDDLLGAGATDRSIQVNLTSGQAVVGDGENGAVPVANAANPDANVIARQYRYGGGLRGNVAAGALNNVVTPVAGLDVGQTTNLYAAAGGSDEETLDDAKKRARRAIAARDRAVTAGDFELLATQAGGVKRAKAVPRLHPQFPDIPVPGAVSVIIVPDSDADAPLPSDGLLQTVCAYLDARRLLTTELFVLAPRYIDVQLQALAVSLDDANTADVKQQVEQALTDYLHPLRGGDDGQGWPFGGTLRYSKLLQRAFSVAGVDSVPQLLLRVDGVDRAACTDVILAAYALVNLTALTIQVVPVSEYEPTT